jgi:molybdate transport system substrate-binding protein
LRGLRACAPAFEAQADCALAIETDHGHAIEARARKGALDADCVLLPNHMIEALTRAGLLDARRADLGAVATSAVVAADAPLPDVGSLAGLKQELRRAAAVLITTAPSGLHMGSVFERLDLADEIAHKILRFDRSADVNEWLRRHSRRAAIGFGPTTEIVGALGVRHGGLIAQGAQMVLSYSAALTPAGAKTACGAAFLDFLGGAPAREAFAQSGVIRR